MKTIILVILVPLMFTACMPKPSTKGEIGITAEILAPPVDEIQPFPSNESLVKNSKVLIIGDSISLGYTPYVQGALVGQYKVEHSPDNSRNSTNTLENLDSWLAEMGQYEIITWNNGMWDCKNFGAEPQDLKTTPEQYESNLIAIAQKLKATGSRIIFFTTTYIPDPQDGLLDKGYENQLNEIAKRVLPPLGVTVYDLGALSLTMPPTMREWGGKDIHYNPQGSMYLTDFVVAAILNKDGK